MKKRIAVILAALMMTAAVAPAVHAEETPGSTPENAIEMSYKDIDESVYEGAWVETGIGFDLYLPVDWVLHEVTEEEAEAQIVGGFLK
jgi:hypothetical protein